MIFLGKGSVLEDVFPPYRNVPEATHCIAEPKKLPNIAIDFDAMARQRIAVVGPLYLNEYIIRFPVGSSRKEGRPELRVGGSIQ